MYPMVVTTIATQKMAMNDTKRFYVDNKRIMKQRPMAIYKLVRVEFKKPSSLAMSAQYWLAFWRTDCI
jgi:hypothetical protein